jgi:predicted Zn-dependent protease
MCEMRRLAICLLLVGLVFAVFPRHQAAQAPGGSIVGRVRIAPGNELKSPVMISLQTRGAVIASVYTDNEGSFGFNGLTANTYHVVIQEKEYLPVDETVPIEPITSPLRYVTIYLTQREAKKTQDPLVIGGNARLAGSNQFTQQIPKRARKEYDKGVRSDRDGKPDEALSHYQKAIELAPDFYEARNNLGSDLLSKSQFPEARQQFEKVVTINPSDAAAYFNLANLSLLTHQYDQSQHWLEQGLSKQPDSAFGQFLQGSLFARSGKPAEAEVSLKRCLELDPFMSKSHLALVNLYMQQKRTNDAASELRVFLKSFPQDPFAPKAKQVLQNLEAGTSK